MNKERLVEELLACAEDDWLALWMISGDVETELGIDDPTENLEITVELARELLKRGLRAGDSPVTGDCVHFNAWGNQDPNFVAAFIRREWLKRGDLPGWGDSPWFAR